MAQPNTYWFFNQGSNDVAKTAGSGTDANFAAITTGTGSAGHVLVFTGSGANDGNPTNTRDTVIIPQSGNMEMPKTFIDNGTTIEQAPLAGTNQGGQSGGNTRYVFCINFDGATASIPYLEFWDNANHNSFNAQVLGSGSATNSMIKGSATTYAAPGSANWQAGAKSLAGSGSANRLELASAAIGSAGGEVYFNLFCLLPSTATPFNETPMATLRYTYS
ncbi:MAG TPA: hypothetical protein ACFYD6_00475 [Candidatus Brocadiia bacterium]|nr:hypothetical protein [Candidatus Brocadiales bacterium]